MNSIMLDGKKSVAERIVYGALEQVEEKAKADPVETFHSALENVAPAVEERIRFLLRFAQSAVRHLQSAGLLLLHASVMKQP